MLRKILLINILLISTLYTKTYAEFIGPTEVLSTTYGSGNGQVGLQHHDSGDEFPWKLAISSTGRIALCDEVNDRVAVFKSDGSFERNINILELSVAFDSNDAIYFSAPFMKFDSNGTMVFEQNVGFDEIYVSLDNKIIGYDRDKKTYSLYSPTGQLIRTTTERPLELGKVKEKKTATGYTYTIQYPDLVNPNTVKTYTINLPGPYERFVRDNTGNINAIAGKAVRKFDSEGREIGVMRTPANEIRTIRSGGGGFEAETEVIAQYGEPVISPTGDVYTWKRTPTTYSIIKWTWRP